MFFNPDYNTCVLGILCNFEGVYTSKACSLKNGLFNLLFVKGIDGLSIVSEYVGCEDLIQYAKEVIADEDKRHDLCHTGINGVVLLGVCYIALLMQVGLPLLIAVNLAFLFL